MSCGAGLCWKMLISLFGNVVGHFVCCLYVCINILWGFPIFITKLFAFTPSWSPKFTFAWTWGREQGAAELGTRGRSSWAYSPKLLSGCHEEGNGAICFYLCQADIFRERLVCLISIIILYLCKKPWLNKLTRKTPKQNKKCSCGSSGPSSSSEQM